MRWVAHILSITCLACVGAPVTPGNGQLLARWSGQDNGTGPLVAQAAYCARDSVLELLAHAGDRGVGLAFHLAQGGIQPGQFTVLHPETVEMPRPAAAGAWRFLGIDQVHAFVSRNGEAELTAVDAEGISGRVTMTLVARFGPDTVVVSGSFRAVPVDSSLAPCGLVPRTPAEIF